MTATTTNYGLIKPDSLDFYDISVSNNNMNIIDTTPKNNEEKIAAEETARNLRIS